MPLAIATPASSAAKKKRPKAILAIGIGGPPDDSPDDDAQSNPAPSSGPSSPAPAAPSPKPVQNSRPAMAPDKPMPTPGGGASPEPSGARPPIAPEDVCCHSDAEKCETCEYMQGDGNCYWLQQPVGPGTEIAWCKLYETKGGEPDADDMGAAAAGAPPPAMAPPGAAA